VVAIGKRPVARKKLARGNELVTRRADATKRVAWLEERTTMPCEKGGVQQAGWELVRQRPTTSGSVPSVEEVGPAAGSSMTLELSL
jgi:hypothetical protein